jgi:hypothetical protein
LLGTGNGAEPPGSVLTGAPPEAGIPPAVEFLRQELGLVLHRAELTVQERAEHIAEWVKLTASKKCDAVQVEQHKKMGQPMDGISAA